MDYYEREPYLYVREYYHDIKGVAHSSYNQSSNPPKYPTAPYSQTSGTNQIYNTVPQQKSYQSYYYSRYKY